MHSSESFQTIKNDMIYLIAIDSINNRERAAALTGEWLIYAIHKTEKYLLTYATHREGKNRKEGDKKIYDRIYTSCFNEYPFLFNL